ncbi:MAG: DUF4105 domain-containing protein [Verrucomicrobiales bacterium]|nr:DUF4105 domain-containing protein [Verrucomicrobiota bacterium JB025]
MSETENGSGWRGKARRVAGLVMGGLGWGLLVLPVSWAFGALWFDFPWAEHSAPAAWLFLIGVLVVVLRVRPFWLAKGLVVLAVLVVAVWWLTLQPRQFRDWKPGVMLPAKAVVEGDEVTLYLVRNFDYRTEEDFVAKFELRKLSLSHLEGVDLFVNYWGSELMAHPIVSFDFGEQGRVCFSIETRMEKGESYSAIGGLYRRFEMFLVVAEERDVIRLRTNYRKGEDVYLYRLRKQDSRALFLDYVAQVNELAEKPRWYNAVTNNCTTAILNQTRAGRLMRRDWRVLVNGYMDRLLYERGLIDRSLPFDELKKLAHVNERARAADQDADFSEKIRAGVPGFGG